MLKGLRLELELTCLSDANVAASTWEIVDGESQKLCSNYSMLRMDQGLCKSRKLMK